MDTAQRDRLRDDLKNIFEGELVLDELHCALYATDASIFRVVPVAVVRPRHESDVQAIVRYAADHQLTLTARGAGTNLAGACLGPGLIVDFSRFMHAILDVGADWVRVQPGVTWERLMARLAADGRCLAAEPASAPTSTLGGMAAINASGPRVARHGYTSDHLVSCRVVLDTGEAVNLGRVPRSLPAVTSDRMRAIHRATVALLDRHAELIVQERPRTTFDRCGYRLDGCLDSARLDYVRLLAGAEGTLALFTELTLRTEPLPNGRGVVLIGCPDLETALQVAQAALPRGPAACELLDGRILSLLRARDAEFLRLVPGHVGAALLIEFQSTSADEARRQTLDFIDEQARGQRPTMLAIPAFAAEDIAHLWRLVDAALPSLTTLRGGPRAVPAIEDVAVPIDCLAEYLTRAQDLLQRHETTAAFLVHVASGQVHARPFLDPTNPPEAARLWAIAEDVCALALDLGGTISSRHGTGLARTPWVAKQFPRLTPVFRELKAIFDPRDLFNPGAIVGPDPSRPAWPLRARGNGIVPADSPGTKAEPMHSAPSSISPPPLPLALLWTPSDMMAQVAACNGCGECRSQAPAQRMCPIFRATRAEEATPRAKANLLQTLLAPGTDPRRLSADDVREVADLCVNCKMCAIECPSRVNIPALMLEAKAANTAEYGLDRPDWVMARVGLFSAAGSSLAPLANRLLRGRITRWVLEKVFGVSRRRRLPPFAARSFVRLAKKWGWTRKKPVGRDRKRASGSDDEPASNVNRTEPDDGRRTIDRVALFVDIFANYHDPEIAEAAVRVLRRNGIEVVVPLRQRSCGMEALAQGDVETARELAQRNLRALMDFVRAGYRVVCPEPTSALALTHDYLTLIDDPDARLLASQTVELTRFLWELHQQGRLRTDFQPLELSLGHHVPCHVKALGHPPAGPALLALVPGVRLFTIDVGCSGMAGTYGLKTATYETSLAAGQALFDELRRPRVLFGATECSSCRMQMEEGAGKVTLHPVQYLALAYGLMPDLAKRLRRPIAGLVAP